MPLPRLSPSHRLKQNENKTIDNLGEPCPIVNHPPTSTISPQALAALFRRPDGIGPVLRVLAHYTRFPQDATRPEDSAILLLVSTAMALARMDAR